MRIDVPTLLELKRRYRAARAEQSGFSLQYDPPRMETFVDAMIQEAQSSAMPGWGGATPPMVMGMDGIAPDGTRYASNGSRLADDPDPTDIMSHTEFELARAAGRVAPVLPNHSQELPNPGEE